MRDKKTSDSMGGGCSHLGLSIIKRLFLERRNRGTVA